MVVGSQELPVEKSERRLRFVTMIYRNGCVVRSGTNLTRIVYLEVEVHSKQVSLVNVCQAAAAALVAEWPVVGR